MPKYLIESFKWAGLMLSVAAFYGVFWLVFTAGAYVF